MKKMLVFSALLMMTASQADAGQYRTRLTVDPEMVSGGSHRDFPVLVQVASPGLRSAANGGHVATRTGEDIYFTLANGRTRIPHDMVSYCPVHGKLEAWVRVPQLSGSRETSLYLYYGENRPTRGKVRTVWEGIYPVVWHGYEKAGSAVDIPASDRLELSGDLTVEAWVRVEDHCVESFQPVVSQWSISNSFDRFDAYDAGNTDDLKTIGFFGAIFDGQYVYFAPQRHGHEEDSTHGYALRYNTQRPFKDESSWEAYDAGSVEGLLTKGHYGAVFDGRYVYYVPRGKQYGGATGTYIEFQSNLLRYDTHGAFKDPASWEAFDMKVNISRQSAAFDGRYIYFCPGYEVNEEGTVVESSRVTRYDVRSPFKEASSYRTVDVSTLCDERTGNYDGAVVAGRYVYFVPLSHGIVLRYDTAGDFGDSESWSTFNARPLGMPMNVGAVFDGQHIYFAAYSSGTIVRYDTGGEFTDAGSWTAYDARMTDGLDTAGFDGNIFDGRYVYFIPFVSPREGGGNNFHSNFLRYDTLGAFEDRSSWTAYDGSNIDGLPTIGYNGGAFDGRYLYTAPWQDRTDGKFGIHGNIIRYDTLEEGSFCLKYSDLGHNGGLGAAVPGPQFIVNTVDGPVSISSGVPLLPGVHHLAGVYDGKTIKLFVNGSLVGERAASGQIQKSAIPVKVGGLANGSAEFRGDVIKARVASRSYNDEWIKTAYRNLRNPSGFVVPGREEMTR